VCNGIKKSKPPRNDALFKAAPPADEVGYFTAIGNNYLWPQKYQPGEVFRKSKPQLQYLSPKNVWKPVSYPVARGNMITHRGQLSRQVKADVLVGTGNKQIWRYGVPVRVHLVPDGTHAEHMVNDLIDLNKTSSSDKRPGGEADIRVWQRTVHWFKVLSTLRDLQGATADSFDRDWRLAMASVQSPGLYSVWVTVIDLLGPGGSWKVPGQKKTSIMTKFLTEIVGEDYFPGTDTADTP
jgi:hypothetical protein